MTLQKQQTSANNCHPLFRELNICSDVKNNVKLTTDKTEDSISPSDVLTFLLENGVVSKESIINSVQTMRRERQVGRTSAKVTEENGVGQRALTNSSSAATIDNEKTTKNSCPAAPQNSTQTHRMRHIALRFFYDGATYSGLAQNIGQENDNSVERCLFDALLKARLIGSRETSNFSRCGRTDKGVSSAGQVVALHLKSAFPNNASWDEDGNSFLEAKDLPKNELETRKVWTVPRSKNKRKKKNENETLTDNRETAMTSTPTKRVEREVKEYSYSKILNNLLPPSIRILGWTPVTDEFSARFSARARIYRYFFCKRRMDAEAIREGLNRLVGKHDFRNLCKMDVEKVYNFERLIHSAELIEIQGSNGELCYLKIIGQAFLWHQIRCIAKIIFMIGEGLEQPSIITDLLDITKHPGKPSYPLADEQPLVLHDCEYPNLHFGYSVQNLWTVSCQLEKQREGLVLAACRIRSCIESLRSCSMLTDDVTGFCESRLSERRKKLEKRGIYEFETNDTSLASSSKVISWGECLSWLEKHDLVPSPTGVMNSVHVPLMQRSMGPSYEQKVENLKKSDKRRLKFEENVIKKRKSAEEDKAFYDHKTKQGGTGI